MNNPRDDQTNFGNQKPFEDTGDFPLPRHNRRQASDEERMGRDQKTNAKINVNTAPRSELLALSGIGPGAVEAIIKFRQSLGGFKDFKDLLQVTGLQEKDLAHIKDRLTFDFAEKI